MPIPSFRTTSNIVYGDTPWQMQHPLPWQNRPPGSGPWVPQMGNLPFPKPDVKTDDKASITKLSSLHQHLQLALMVELSTVPVYLYALYSIDPVNDKSGAAEVITSVVIEEMLHLILVGNVLKSVGGSPKLYPTKGVLEYWPRYPMDMAGHEGHLRLNLKKADLGQICTFLQIERPMQENATAEEDNYDTLGQFYEAVQIALRDLDPQVHNLFHPDSLAFQFDKSDKMYNEDRQGGIQVVTNVATANAALQTIIDQGEGAGGTRWDNPTATASTEEHEVAHFFKFVTLLNPLPAVLPLVQNPHTIEYKDEKIKAVSLVFDASYCLLLLSIQETWGTSRVTESAARKGLIGNFYTLMLGVLKPLATYLVTQPIEDGKVAGPTFNYYEYQTQKPVAETVELIRKAIALYGRNVPAALTTAETTLKGLYELKPAS